MAFTDRIFPTEADRLAHACGAFDRNQQWKVTATLKIYKIARQGVGGQCWEYLYTDEGDAAGDNLATSADMDLYLDPVGGDDDNAGTSTSAAVRTAERVDELVPLILRHRVRVHLKAGTFTCSRSYWFGSRVLQGGAIFVYADEAWDANVYSEIATDTLHTGSGETVLVDPSGELVTDEFSGYTIELLTGDCAGQRRTVRNNTTSIYPVEMFNGMALSSGPDQGDTFRVFTNACVLSIPTGNFWLMMPTESNRNVIALHVEGLTVTGTADQSYLHVAGAVAFAGFRTNVSVYIDPGGVAIAGNGDSYTSATLDPEDDSSAEWDTRLGWGFTSTYAGSSPPISCVDYDDGGSVVGYFHVAGGTTSGSLIRVSGALYGGRYKTLASSLLHYLVGAYWSVDTNTSIMVDRDVSVGTILGSGKASRAVIVDYLTFAGTYGSPRLRIGAGAIVYMFSNVSGQSSSGSTVVSYAGNSSLLLESAPALGRTAPDTDWNVGDGSPFDKSFFASAGDRKFFNGRLMERVA